MTVRIVLGALAGWLLLAGAASADGLPVLGVDAGPGGVPAAAGDIRYVTVPAGRGTTVAGVEQVGGRVRRSLFLRGEFTVPAVAYDASPGGLSFDRGTLVLIRPRTSFPRATTTFAVLDAQRLRLRRIVTLRGDFSFDAISPDGRSLYLVNYTSPRDPTRYAVRVYDLRARRLLSAPVIDPREPGEAMRGRPITRATSADGRWAYTLYDGAGGEPFVHALDTTARRAACIDLPMLEGRRDLNALRLALAGTQLRVVARRRAAALVDTRTFHARRPAAARVDASAGGHGDRSARWLIAAGAGAALLLAGAAALRRRHTATA